jgi:hypothetical protein
MKVGVQTRSPVLRGKATLHIYDVRGLLIAGWSFDAFQLPAGEHEVFFTFTDLPVRPGAYSVTVSIYDDRGDQHYWTLVPPLVLCGKPLTHFMDEWSGILNVGCSIDSKQVSVGAEDEKGRPVGA